jgi:putative oxidoreductase
MASIAAIVGRILIAILFVAAGANKFMDPGGTEQMLASQGMSPSLVWVVAGFEVVAGLALALGFGTRIASLALFGFTILTIVMFHNDFNDPAQVQIAMKNAAIAGGLLLAFAYGHVVESWKVVRARREGEVEANEARAETREVELEKARAEGRAEGLAQAGRAHDGVDVDGDGKAET